MTTSERQLPTVSLEDLDITDVIQTLRGVTASTCTYCGKVHQAGCGLTTHLDANYNTTIPWSESVNGKAITRLKGPGAS